MISPKELQEYVAVMREQGITALKLEGLEVVLGPLMPPPGTPDRGHVKDDYNKLLFAATEGYEPDEDNQS